MDTIWKKALGILKNEVNDQVFSAWFCPISEVFSDEKSIVLGVPNKFFENWVRDKYYSLINTALQQAAGKDLSITFKVQPTGAQQKGSQGLQSAVPEPPSASSDKGSSGGWFTSIFSGTKQMPETKYKELGLNPNYTFEAFVVGSSNRFAHAASLAVCERLSKAYNPLFLHGGVGLGKTHLMQAMGHEVLKRYAKSRVLYISGEEFTNQLIQSIRTKTTDKFRAMYRTVDILLIDDIQFIAGRDSTQEEFFNSFICLLDAHKQIVLCSDRSP